MFALRTSLHVSNVLRAITGFITTHLPAPSFTATMSRYLKAGNDFLNNKKVTWAHLAWHSLDVHNGLKSTSGSDVSGQLSIVLAHDSFHDSWYRWDEMRTWNNILMWDVILIAWVRWLPEKDRENGFQGKQEGQNSMSQQRTENENCGGKYMYLFTQCIFYITYMSKNIHISWIVAFFSYATVWSSGTVKK